ncbi:alpha-1-macroglobulin-like, partial [Scleropages formosus]
FSSDQAVPGEEVVLQLKAWAGSLCGLTVLDQSVTLMDPEKTLTAKKVHPGVAYFSTVNLLCLPIKSVDQWEGSTHLYHNTDNKARAFFPETWLWDLVEVTVMVATSTDYTLKPMADSEYSTCVCQWKTFRWTLIPSVLGSVNVSVTAEAVQSQTICDNEVVSVPEKGRIDTVTLPLLVKAEGTEKSVNHGWLLCPNGYQRQMMYQHSNGAFSTFGDESTQNSWLTAFVMRSFNRMQSFVYVDPKLINEARKWLERKQKKDGCFQTVGKLFNNRMKGGVTDDVTMTAYITAALLEMNMSVSEPVLTKSLACLRNAASGFLYWSPPSSDASSSLSVEMSSYVLLAVLNHTPLSSYDLGQAARIAGWLVRQQNSQGGFSSTQDTVVALQALSFYATLTYNPEGSATVAVQSSDKELHRFEVDQSNRLLNQERVLHHIPGQYTIEAQGTGCVSVQIVLHYNIPPPTDVSVFDLKESSVVDRTEIENDHIPENTPKNITIELRQEVLVKNLKPAVVKVYDYYQT